VKHVVQVSINKRAIQARSASDPLLRLRLDLIDLDLSTVKIWYDIACERFGPKKMKHEDIGVIARRCINLERLCFRDTQSLHAETLQAIIENCPRIKFLDLFGCRKISEAAFSVLSLRYSGLEYLDLSHCRYKALLPSSHRKRERERERERERTRERERERNCILFSPRLTLILYQCYYRGDSISVVGS